MSASNVFETDLLELLFLNTTLANFGDATGLVGSTGAGNLTVALHTNAGSPGEGGDQSTNETTYGSYARQSVARSGSGWAVAAGVADNAALITFPQASSGSDVLAHVSIGGGFSNNMFFYGALTATLTITAGVTQPEFAIGALDISLD